MADKQLLITPEEVAQAQRYDEEEYPFIESLILGAQQLLKTAGAFVPSNPLCKVTIHLIVGYWLENRDQMSYDFKNIESLPVSITALINVIRFNNEGDGQHADG